jgi:hypothetical protein
MAGFEVTPYGRFCLTPKAQFLERHATSEFRSSCAGKRQCDLMPTEQGHIVFLSKPLMLRAFHCVTRCAVCAGAKRHIALALANRESS